VQQHQLKLEEEVAARTGELQQINHQLRQEVEERLRAERAANYRAERESLLAGLSALFLKTRQSEVDAAVESALSRIGQFLHVDRCYLMASDPTGELLVCTHEWTREGVVSNKNGDGNLVQASLPLAPSSVPGLGSLVVSHRHDQDHPAFHPQLAEARGARSVLMVQTADGTQESRFLGVDCVDGLRRWQEVDASLLGMAAEPLLSCLNRRKIEGDKQTLQGQLTQAQKMEAVGKLSSGIAHDFNNMLLPIIGYADMVIGRLPPGDPNIFELTEIRQVAQRAATLTRQLLTFSRKQVITKTVFNVNEALVGMRSMLRRIIGEDNQMRWHLAEDLLCIKADIGQIEQIVMNLCVNARDAMAPNGGTIDITTMNLRAEAHPLPLIGGKTAREGEFVCLAVADTGTGIPAEVAQRIFEPFFTTKGQEGTGLGLSVIYGILQEHGGGIDLRSEVGKGTVFHVYLPAVRQQPSPAVVAATATPTPAAAVAAEPERKYIGHGQSVLLVEDEESVNRLVRTALTQNGYRVTSADCYTDAIRKFEQHRGEFDMIFSDAVLPDGNGVDLISVFRNHNPNLRVLLSSGYTDRHHLMDMAKLQQMSFLSKPYTLPKLFQTVAEVMEDQTQHMLV
jgi:signal transduction histidine kinase/CheY-like chemotaxis protein